MARTPLRQLRLVKTADVYKAGVPAGVLRRLPDRTEFLYLAEYFNSGEPASGMEPADPLAPK